MIPLDVGDQLVDREKSRIFLHYLANAAKKVQERELRHRKTEIAVKQFNKLDTVHLDKQLGTIEDHLQQALRQEQMRQCQAQSNCKAQGKARLPSTYQTT